MDVVAVRFWISNTNGSLADPAINFSGTISYAFYNNNAGNGSLIASGTVSGLTSVLSRWRSVRASTGWKIHAGVSLRTSYGTGIGWKLSNGASGNAKQGLAANGLLQVASAMSLPSSSSTLHSEPRSCRNPEHGASSPGC
jgi:hypothetical protein